MKLQWYKPTFTLFSHIFKDKEIVSICGRMNRETTICSKINNPKFKCEDCLKKREELDWLDENYHL